MKTDQASEAQCLSPWSATEYPCLSRRGFLKAASLVAAGAMFGPSLARAAMTRERIFAAYSPNTGELIRTVYWVPDEGYIQDSIAQISHFMRDHHNNLIKPIDPKLVDQLYAMQMKLDPHEPMHLLCGYRSPSTNARLRRRSRGVAKNSYHIRGRAADIRFPGQSTRDLYRAALDMKAGGLGYYPRSRFIHMDTGPVRTWS